MHIRPFQPEDWDDWLRLSLALFPHHTPEELLADMRAFLARGDAAVFLAVRPDGSACGFIEVGSRPYADGCETSPVGYVEAWYVELEERRQGHGRALLQAAEEWARGAGYQEMASDAELDNLLSQQVHERSGYEEVGRVVQFRKILDR